MWSEDLNNEKRTLLVYVNPSVPYSSMKHILLMLVSVVVVVFVFLPPLLILVVYPTSLYRKISHWISPKWRLRIKTYVEIFYSSSKDGTNGTQDYRMLSGWILLLSGVFPKLLIAIIARSVQGSQNTIFLFTCPIAIFFGMIAFLCTLLQPYKERASNALTAGLLIVSSLIFATVTGFLDQAQSKLFRVVITTLLLVPHCACGGMYVLWRILTTHCCKCPLKANRERDRLLQRSSESINYVLWRILTTHCCKCPPKANRERDRLLQRSSESINYDTRILID